MSKSEKGNNSVKYWHNFRKIWSGHLHLVPRLCAWSQVVFQIFWFTILLYHTKCRSRKREIIQSNIYRMFPIVNQVIYTLNATCVPNIMILAQAVLQIFCSQSSIDLLCKNEKRGITLQWQIQQEKKKIRVRLFFMLIPYIKFQDPVSNRSWPYAKCFGQMHTGSDRRAQTNMPHQLRRSWGHKMVS